MREGPEVAKRNRRKRRRRRRRRGTDVELHELVSALQKEGGG